MNLSPPPTANNKKHAISQETSLSPPAKTARSNKIQFSPSFHPLCCLADVSSPLPLFRLIPMHCSRREGVPFVARCLIPLPSPRWYHPSFSLLASRLLFCLFVHGFPSPPPPPSSLPLGSDMQIKCVPALERGRKDRGGEAGWKNERRGGRGEALSRRGSLPGHAPTTPASLARGSCVERKWRRRKEAFVFLRLERL